MTVNPICSDKGRTFYDLSLDDFRNSLFFDIDTILRSLNILNIKNVRFIQTCIFNVFSVHK